MGRMHGVRKQHGLVVAQGIQQLFVALNESLLLFFVELARDDIGFVIFEPLGDATTRSVLTGLRKRRRIACSTPRRRPGAYVLAARPRLTRWRSAEPDARRFGWRALPSRLKVAATPRSSLSIQASAKCGWCRRPAYRSPSQSPRSSSHRLATPARYAPRAQYDERLQPVPSMRMSRAGTTARWGWRRQISALRGGGAAAAKALHF